MVTPRAEHRVGPLRAAWFEHRHGTPSDPVVRGWLAGVLGGDAAGPAIDRDPHCRPRLRQPGIDANWSHSGDRLLVAVGEGLRVGADVERLHHRPRALELAQRYFTADEAGWLATHAGDARDTAFLRLWCAKESVLKAHGRGIAFGLHRLAFAAGDDGALRLVDCDPALGDAASWTVREHVPEPGYLAAFAWRST